MKHYSILIYILILNCILFGCKDSTSTQTMVEETTEEYFTYSEAQKYDGGIQMIPIQTPKGTFNVYTKRVGNNPKIKVLLLHGGPGGTHEEFGCADGYFPQEGIEYIYYDQLDSYYSDQPNDSTLWTTDRFVDEVDQVRKALNLNKDNFYLLGQSWGGMLAMEYALQHQDQLKGLIISNMVASVPEYNKYANEVLAPQLPEDVLGEIQSMESNKDYANPRYEELLMEYFYTEHIMRKPLEEWPKSVLLLFQHLNPKIYTYMQGPSEFGITADASLSNWDVSKRLPEITVPTLMIGAAHDTMDPEYMKWMSTQVKNGKFLYCENGSHLSQYDDQKTYFSGVIEFLREVDKESDAN